MGGLEVVVMDRGQKTAAEALTRLFEEYGQADKSIEIRGQAGGTGEHRRLARAAPRGKRGRPSVG